MIKVQNISKKLGAKLVLDEVNFSLKKGGITAIIGANGAGKSTLLSLMARLLPLDCGQISFDDLDTGKTPSDVLAKKISILTQSNYISARLTVLQLVMFGRFPHHKGRPQKADHAHVAKILELMELDEIADRFIDQLSGGQQQRAYIAMILSQDSDYILLDEPLNNLDMKHARNIMQSLRKIADEMNKSIILVIHDINFAAAYSDLFIALKDGKIIVQGSVDEVMTEGNIELIYDMQVDIKTIDGKKHAFYYT
ncbi:MAG: ATP-binding cassette domain-containing protein [Alphaproteobacteria bacterium]|nr:ATP-binding cassette domain-containing protein [Alphaproteobacteria bacterium]